MLGTLALLIFQGMESAAVAETSVAAKLPPLPWHMADIWWTFAEKTPHFESLDVDVTFDRDVPTNVNLYVSPCGLAKINNMDFYGGLQTAVNGWASKESRERVHPGPGAIFSRWSHDKKAKIGLEHVRMVTGGLCESAGYEGEFCSVRRPLAWKQGTYTWSVVRGDQEIRDGTTNTWFHGLVREHATGQTQVIGSLRFEGTDFTFWARHAAFVEIYATAKLPHSAIPEVTVTFGYPRLNGQRPRFKSASVNHPAPGEQSATPNCATAEAAGDKVIVKIGPLFERDAKDRKHALELKLP
jgi:hypothetical protein